MKEREGNPTLREKWVTTHQIRLPALSQNNTFGNKVHIDWPLIFENQRDDFDT